MIKKIIFLPLLMLSTLFAFENQNISDYKIINPPAQIDTSKASKLYFTGEYLYWIAQEIGLATSVKADLYIADPDNVGRSMYVPKGTINKIDPKFDSGFRLKIGYKFDRDNWDNQLCWTWYKTTKSDSFNGSSDVNATTNQLIPLWGGGIRGPNVGGRHIYYAGDFDLASSVNSKFKFEINNLDYELARALYISKNLSIRPFIGARGSIAEQRLEIRYNAFTSNTGGLVDADAIGVYTVKPRSDFIAIGPRAGMDFKYDFYRGFGIYAIGSLSMLFSKFDTNYQINYENHGNLVNVRDKFSSGISNSQLAAGINYNYEITKQKTYFQIQALWEQNILFSVNKMLKLMYRLEDGNVMRENSDLTLSGLTINARIDF
jgi:hypothetical protein